MYFPFKRVDSFMAKLLVFSTFPLWSVWIGWRNKIDLLIAFGSIYAFMQGPSKWFLKRPMVTLIRGSLTFGFRMQDSSRYFLYLNKKMENTGLYFSDRIITNNVASRSEMLKSLGKRRNIDVQVLYNNIPPMNIREPEDILKMREKYGIPGDAKVLATAGILSRGKNIETLIKCLPKVEVKDLYLLIIGDGSTNPDFNYKDSLQRLAKQLGVDKKVIFTGWLEKEKLWKLYLASDLFVLPSLSEGMPNAMLEALGAGLPCMGSNIAGVKDILQYDELMFDPMDEQTVINKVRQLFSDPQYLYRIKKLCQDRKKAFSFQWKEKVFQVVTEGILS